MNRVKPAVCLSLALTAGLLFVHCVDKIAGNTSETGNAITAMLYNPGGTPAKNAKVRFYPVNFNPRTGMRKSIATMAVDSTTTDANGTYTAKLDTGTYNVLGAGDSGVVYQDSIKVVKNSTVHPPADTLKAPGGLRGLIRLQPGDDARTVFILFMGTNSWGTPDDSTGGFGVANMAKGRYRVRILTTLDAYVPKDTVLSVTAGKVDTLAHDIVLQYTGIPVPGGLKIAYDTMKQIVTLNWNKPTTGRFVKGYNIYRRNVDSNATLKTINPQLIVDTVYRDSTGVQDLTYEYRVAAVDTQGTEGIKSPSANGSFLTIYYLAYSAGSGKGTGNGYFNNLSAISSGINERIYCADAYNYRIQMFDSYGVFISSWGTHGTRQGEFGDRITDLAADSAGNIYVVDNGNNRIQIFDSNGTFVSTWTSIDTNWQGFGKIAIYKDFIFVGSNYGIQIFNRNGQYIRTIIEIDGSPNPFAIAANDSVVFVAQNTNSSEIILKYSYSGVFLETIFSRTAADTSLGKGRIDDLCYNSVNKQLLYLDRTDAQIRGVGLNGIELWHIAPQYKFTQESYQYSMSLTKSNSILIGYTDGHFQKYKIAAFLKK